MEYPQTVNINVYSRVILTKKGAEDLNKYFRQYHFGVTEKAKEWDETYFPTSYKEGDVFETELHHLMNIFGVELIPGNDVPFKNNEITFLKL